MPFGWIRAGTFNVLKCNGTYCRASVAYFFLAGSSSEGSISSRLSQSWLEPRSVTLVAVARVSILCR